MTTSLSDAEYFAHIARKISSAGCIIRDDAGRLLVANPTYKPGWEVPGGVCEAGEAPRATATREVREELGLYLKIGRALCVDHTTGIESQPDALHFLFDGGVVSDGTIGAFRLPPDELSVRIPRHPVSNRCHQMIQRRR